MKNANDTGTYDRKLGLGAPPPTGVGSLQDIAGINSAMNCGFTQVPVIEYVTWTVALPVGDANIASTFGDSIDLLNNPMSVPGVTSVDSSFVQNGQLQVDMLVAGFGIHVFGEPIQGSFLCNYINPTPAAGSAIMSPDSFTANDIAHGAFGAGVTATTTTVQPAIIEWGGAVQEAMWHLVNAYQFIWTYQQRNQLVNELAADVAYFGSYAEASAAGSSQLAVQRLARRVNDTYQSQGALGSFEPINAQRIGSFTSAVAPTGNVGLFHPTRAYDLMDATYGGLQVQGRVANGPFRKLIKPVLLERGLPIGMKLQVQDEYHQKEFQRYLSQTDSTAGTVANIPFAASSGGLTVAGTGTNEFNELTLDATPIAVSQQVQTDRVLAKGGSLQIAILIKGFEVWGQWRNFLASSGGQMASLIEPSAGLAGLAQ